MTYRDLGICQDTKLALRKAQQLGENGFLDDCCQYPGIEVFVFRTRERQGCNRTTNTSWLCVSTSLHAEVRDSTAT